MFSFVIHFLFLQSQVFFNKVGCRTVIFIKLMHYLKKKLHASLIFTIQLPNCLKDEGNLKKSFKQIILDGSLYNVRLYTFPFTFATSYK